MTDDSKRVIDDGEEGAVHASVEAEVVSSEPGDDAPPATDYPELRSAAHRDSEADEERRAGLSKDHKQWAMFCHLAGLAGFVIPFGGVVAPIILWQMKKDESPFIEEQGREAVNFNITVAVAAAVTFAVMFVTMFFFIGFLLMPVLFGIMVAHVAYAVIAGLKAGEGVDYRYPWSIRFVK